MEEGREMQAEPVLRPATGADRDAVMGIVSGMWGCDITSRHEWLYRRNPHGAALTWVAEEADGERAIAAVTSLFPRRVLVDGHERMGSIGGDCFVLPRARRKGLATRLHRTSFAAMRGEGVSFMYGPPVANNLAALLKAGSDEVTVFRRWTRPLTGQALVGMIARWAPRPVGSAVDLALRLLDGASSTVRRATLEPLTAFPPETAALMDAASRTRGVVPLRDPDWLAWRYFTGPAHAQRVYALRLRGALAGFVVLEALGKRATLVDVAVPPDRETLDAAIGAAVREARALGCDVLDANFTPGSPVAARLCRHGFFAREAHGFQVALAAGGADDDRAALLGPGWTFSDGDKDRDTSFPGA
jgi:GNAT superfamily N-acetyltransferase